VTFEQILLLYIYNHKKVSLNLFGTIELDGAIPEPDIVKKERALSVEGLKFTFNPHVATDEEFIKFYAYEKGRILSLSSSDIEAQLGMARQIVNIGNPFEITGVGKIVKMDNGNLTIIPGYFTIPPESGSGRPTPLRERVQTAALPKGDANKEKSGGIPKINLALILGVAGAVAGIALLVWAFIKFGLPLFQTDEVKNEDFAVPAIDTVQSVSPVILSEMDTTVISSNAVVPPTGESELVNWKAYISKTNQKNFAEERLSRYKGYGHNVILESPDSNQFLIYIPIQSAIIDTAKKRDSLARFFAFPVRLEKMELP
jgi:hypothetical protein